MEINNTLVLLSKFQKKDLPELMRIDEELAEAYDWDPCFVYIRPFTQFMLSSLSNKYKIIIYSVLPPLLLKYIVKWLQSSKVLIENHISTFNDEGPKSISKFWANETISPKDTVLIDHDPEVVALNSGNWVPMIKYTGRSKDSALLYLEKYLMDLSSHPNVRSKLTKDFRFGPTKKPSC